MKFKIPPAVYRVRICDGELRVDGSAVAAVTHRRVIYISGDIHPAERSERLYDQLRLLWEQHHGAFSAAGVAAFTTEFSRQLNAQGGEAALMRLQPDGVIDAGAVEDMAGEVTGCECAKCGTRYAPHQIRTGPPVTHTGTGNLSVLREIDCEFCGLTMTWLEGATQAGLPNGRVMNGPQFHPIRPSAA